MLCLHRRCMYKINRGWWYRVECVVVAEWCNVYFHPLEQSPLHLQFLPPEPTQAIPTLEQACSAIETHSRNERSIKIEENESFLICTLYETSLVCFPLHFKRDRSVSYYIYFQRMRLYNLQLQEVQTFGPLNLVYNYILTYSKPFFSNSPPARNYIRRCWRKSNSLLHGLERLEIGHEQPHHPISGPQIGVQWLLHWQCRNLHMKQQVLCLEVSV